MINRINKIKSKNPKLRKIFNIIFSLFNEVLILSYISLTYDYCADSNCILAKP